MKVLVLGGGAREHALAWRLAASPSVREVVCLPGNPGMAAQARCLPGDPTDPATVVAAAEAEGADLVVVGPEAPLLAGVSDALRERGIAVAGPSRAAATVEGSKAFAKRLMAEAGVPTAAFRVFDRAEDAVAFLRGQDRPWVVKADGLASGKGVIVPSSPEEAVAAVEAIMVRRAFGEAGARVVVEERLEGEEVSVIALVDGRHVLPLLPAQDHKRLGEGDVGPNTGGMGAYAPVPFLDERGLAEVTERVLQPVVDALAARGTPYRGVLYAGLMLTADGPRVLEFNARFGDPEAEALLPLLEGDLGELLMAAAVGDLGDARVAWRPGACVCVVLAAPGYPGEPRRDLPIDGLERAAALTGIHVFHAGTAVRDGRFVTAGGRVAAVSAVGPTLRDAVDAAYDAVSLIRFPGRQFRRDIAARALHPRR
ncbi:MAG: phosphoribosylamine--glycine ligase [Clostridia bacterium]|nr:phosphoribosylamine--glycine ligase [Clostridia bacterium]